jgi:hypothetical protein
MGILFWTSLSKILPHPQAGEILIWEIFKHTHAGRGNAF